MKPIAFHTDAVLTGFSTRLDGSLGFRGTTPELTSEEKVALMELQGKAVELMIHVSGHTGDTVKVNESGKRLTMSQKLRQSIWAKWQAMGAYGDSEMFYAKEMRRLIQMIEDESKARL